MGDNSYINRGNVIYIFGTFRLITEIPSEIRNITYLHDKPIGNNRIPCHQATASFNMESGEGARSPDDKEQGMTLTFYYKNNKL